MKFNVDKKMVLTVVSGLCGIGSVLVGLMSKNDEINEAAEKAAKIIMERNSTNDNSNEES